MANTQASPRTAQQDGKEDKPDNSNSNDAAGSSNDLDHDPKNLGDLLQELRILLQGVQVLTAFLVILPFNEGFARIDEFEKWVYIATFICSVTGLVLFSAPAAQHRIARPLMDRVRFKEFATRMTIMGLIPSSLALILATQLVVSEVIGWEVSWLITGIVTLIIGTFWWVLPLAHKEKEQK
jgi:hypothetical protein